MFWMTKLLFVVTCFARDIFDVRAVALSDPEEPLVVTGVIEWDEGEEEGEVM